MATQYDDLRHALTIKFGLRYNEPTDTQLELILRRIELIRLAGRIPTLADWRNITASICSTFQTTVYSGVDNSDLNLLLSLAKNK